MVLPIRNKRQRLGADGLMTADELLTFRGDGVHEYELEAGRLVVMEPPGFEHGDILGELFVRLRAHAHMHHLGRVVTDAGYLLARSPDTVRSPDISFVRSERIFPGRLTPKYFVGAPDLAVEVISPTDRARDVEQKIDEYFRAGAQLVWVIYPERRTVTTRYPSGESRVLHPIDVLDGGDVVPGFRCTVGQLFVD